ncbi:sensor histidine kinase [Natronobiforma cellulositropha]|uniref:sensor histidine kinase n=1 Tax=Natronobiforma cellulositropha TaxID=1679076 RepID=UPI0021D56FA8|nr:HAMP domain-containing sensor histidine kinase [Natronobiforma cellulositropha]
MQHTADTDDWLWTLGEQLPVSPLSALGVVLAAVIGLRVAAQNVATQALLEGVFPLLAAATVVLVDRWLLTQDVTARDRLSVFAYGLGGFLAASLVTGLHLHVLTLHGTSVVEPLYLTLLSGTVGVAAGSIAGLYEVRQRAAVREARRQNARLEEFASVVSHDLRNPLNVAQGRLEETYRTGNPDHLREVAAALERMNVLIDETLSIARGGRYVDDPEEVQLVALVSDAWATVDTGEATLETDGTRTLSVDRSRARQLFENLFRNAVDHGPDDVCVRVGTTQTGFFVEDDGPGIPAVKRTRVLERGFSTAADGSGLGLSIVRAIADAHNWSVSVTESESGGARFEFTRR